MGSSSCKQVGWSAVKSFERADGAQARRCCEGCEHAANRRHWFVIDVCWLCFRTPGTVEVLSL
jgi:hypothetical protein